MSDLQQQSHRQSKRTSVLVRERALVAALVMNRVLDRLFVGDTSDLDGTAPLVALGFVGVLDLRDGAHGTDLGVPVARLINRDGDPWSSGDVEGAYQFIHRRIVFGRVLVACAAGMSRSVSIVTGYLVRCGWDAASAFRHVKQARPQAAPVSSMLRSALNVAAQTETQ